jgi:hypothetical protein
VQLPFRLHWCLAFGACSSTRGFRALSMMLLAAVCPILTAGCAAETQKTTQAVQQTCPQLSSSVDPIAFTYSSDAQANAKLRSFVSAARGLSDASKKMETLAIEACAGAAREIGVNISPAQNAVDAACAPVAAELNALRAAGVQIKITVGNPICSVDVERRGQCETQCPPGDTPCLSGCTARGEAYARCTLPTVDVELSPSSERAMRLAAALRTHLPRLVYAEVALGKRLINHVQTMVRVGGDLPPIMQKAGLFGWTCVVAGVAASAEAATRIESVLSGSAAVGRHMSL